MFNILVVDDQAHIRRLYEYTLEKNGYQPYTAGDGAQALKLMETTQEQKITVGSTTLIYDSFTLIQNGTEVQMPKKEFQILFKLLSFPNKTFTRANLMEEFWDMDSESEARTVDVHINRLRDRLKDNKDIQIVTVRGLGYKAVKTADKPQGAS